MLRYFIFIEYGLLPDLRVGVLISASQTPNIEQITFSLTILITLIRIILKSTQLYITFSVSLWKAKNLMM